ncbi:MAG TPA: tetratricopeptide repeat protein, partial [Verrucomicrobiae bacterium]|nr:tetratricopeptide repeat protein [Verrucomicrobiae bacterium]
HRLRSDGNFAQAETILRALLAENPSDVEAALMLMRLYAQDLRHGEKAETVLRSLEQQPNIAPAYLEYARHSIMESSR